MKTPGMKIWPFLLLLAGQAAAQPAPPSPSPARLIPPFHDRGTVTLRNATSQPLNQVFLWSHGMPPEGEDRLAGAALPPGGTRALELGMGHCNNELRVRFADGAEFHTAPVALCFARELVLEAGPPPAARVIPR
jgi:hypothetical protein